MAKTMLHLLPGLELLPSWGSHSSALAYLILAGFVTSLFSTVHLGRYLQPCYTVLIFQLSSCIKKTFAGQPGQSDFINSSSFMG